MRKDVLGCGMVPDGKWKCAGGRGWKFGELSVLEGTTEAWRQMERYCGWELKQGELCRNEIRMYVLHMLMKFQIREASIDLKMLRMDVFAS